MTRTQPNALASQVKSANQALINSFESLHASVQATVSAPTSSPVRAIFQDQIAKTWNNHAAEISTASASYGSFTLELEATCPTLDTMELAAERWRTLHLDGAAPFVASLKKSSMQGSAPAWISEAADDYWGHVDDARQRAQDLADGCQVLADELQNLADAIATFQADSSAAMWSTVLAILGTIVTTLLAVATGGTLAVAGGLAALVTGLTSAVDNGQDSLKALADLATAAADSMNALQTELANLDGSEWPSIDGGTFAETAS